MYELTALGVTQRVATPTEAIALFIETPAHQLPALISFLTVPPSIVASTTLQTTRGVLQRHKRVSDSDPDLAEAHKAYRC